MFWELKRKIVLTLTLSHEEREIISESRLVGRDDN